MKVVREGGYPELRVDGTPFFVHSGTFFYFRTPRDQWETSLDGYRALGINTIDLLIPWNWHEPRDGEFDFDGHTNSRRDLRGLLQLISERGFKLIVRPGPIISADWRHAGYPEWLLAQPEYAMDPAARSAGRAPPVAELAATDAEAAARGWMANPVHMARVRRWLSAAAAELAPFSARRSLTVRVRNAKGEFEPKTISGPLIFVQAGDVLPAGAHGAGAELERYRNALREILEAGGLEGPFFVHAGQAGAVSAGPMGTMGDWFPRLPEKRSPDERGYSLSARDAAELESAVQRLKTQPALPPMLIGYQAGWPAPPDDARPAESQPANTLLSSRLAIAHGARGLNYFPLQDSLTPAGYEAPGVGTFYRWDAALDLAGNEKPRSRAVLRNAQMLAMWAERLAATHTRADFGVALSSGTGDRRIVMQISRVAFLLGVTQECVDPETQPVEDFLRHALVVLPPRREPLSGQAQRTLVEYVRRGGTLAVLPPRPAGEFLEEMWKADSAASQEKPRSWNFGEGHVVESEDFFSWVELEEDFVQTRMRGEQPRAAVALQQLLLAAGVHSAVKRAVGGPATGELAITQLVSNAGTGLLGARTGGEGFLMVTNLSYDEAGEENIEVLSPRAGARDKSEDFIRLPVHIPQRESLLLPLHYSLCTTAKPEDRCRDEVIAAGAELLHTERDGHTLELTFYAPARAIVLLRLARQPGRVQLEEFRPEAEWTPARSELHVSIPRGAWPTFERTLRITLPYTPFFPEPPKEKRRGRKDFDFSVADAVRLFLGDDAALPTYPPLVLLDTDGNGQMLLQGTNYDDLGRDVDFRVEGPVHGTGDVGLSGGETRQTVLTLKSSPEGRAGGNGAPGGEEILRGELEARSGRDRRRMPLQFVTVPKEGTTAYEFDFDRDGASEWVLENSGLRLVVAPEAGGRALALLDKNSRTSLLTSVGGMMDRIPGASGTVAYSARWLREEKNTALWLGASGGELERTIRLSGPDSVEVSYRFKAGEGPSRVVVNSVPAALGERGTQFCWKQTSDGAAPHCEPFVAGASLKLPEEAQGVEIRTPGRPTLALEWDAGRMRVQMKNYSALLALEVAGAAGNLRLVYKVVAAE